MRPLHSKNVRFRKVLLPFLYAFALVTGLLLIRSLAEGIPDMHTEGAD